MKIAAVGYIGTRGLVGNIEATDAMLRAANVELIGTSTISAGLVTVVVTGEMGAVKATTEVGVETASRVGELLTVHVIPRPHADTTKILPKPGPAAK